LERFRFGAVLILLGFRFCHLPIIAPHRVLVQ
jgi:hypothetical protein